MSEKNGHKAHYLRETGMGFTERNTNRWAIYGSQHSKIERLLTRTDNGGRVVETCHIGAVGYKGKMRSLGKIHGKLMNILEWFFFKLGKPADNVIKISTISLFDYLTDIHSMFDETKRKNRNGSKFRNWLYDTLHVLSQVVLIFSSWETKEGPDGGRSFKIIKSFKMWGKHRDAERGLVLIELDADYAASLRARNTAPLLIEVENSIQGEIAYTLYRYLRQVLFKGPHFKMKLVDLQNNLAIGHSRKDRMIDDFRIACLELTGMAIPNGSISSCHVERDDISREWYLVAILGKRPVLLPMMKQAQQAQKKREEELKRMLDSKERDKQVLARYESLAGAERELVDKQIDAGLAKSRWGRPEMPGYAPLRESVILDVMEQYHLNGIDRIGSYMCVDENQDGDTHRTNGRKKTPACRDAEPVPYGSVPYDPLVELFAEMVAAFYAAFRFSPGDHFSHVEMAVAVKRAG